MLGKILFLEGFQSPMMQIDKLSILKKEKKMQCVLQQGDVYREGFFIMLRESCSKEKERRAEASMVTRN